MKKQLFLFIAILAMMAGCTKKDSVLSDIVEVEVRTVYGSQTAKALFNTNDFDLKPATGITVGLYKTQIDAINGSNKVASGVTDEEGFVHFKNLEEGEYYIEASNQTCISNLESLVKNESKVNLKRDIVAKVFYTSIDQVSGVDLNNYLGKSIYATIDYDEKKELIPNGGTKSILLTPTSFIKEAYLDHTIKLYNDFDDKEPFRTIEIKVNANCEVLPVDLR